MKLSQNLTYKITLLLALIIALTSFFYFQTRNVFAQCLQSSLNEGLLSAVGTIAGNTGNVNQICVTGTEEASYREFKVPSYQDLEDQYYSLNLSGYKKTIAPPQSPSGTLNFSTTGNGIYVQNGNLAINSASGTGVQVIFVRGNLNINGNITYANNDINSGLVFIVRDNIYIAPSVTQVNAVLIVVGQNNATTGIICTSWNGTACANVPPASQLVINGSLISLNKYNLTSPESAIKLVRDLNVNDRAAEVINKQTKFLYILRGGILTKDLIIQTEDQQYDIPGAAATPFPTPTPLPSTSCTQLSNPAGIDLLEIPGCVYI